MRLLQPPPLRPSRRRPVSPSCSAAAECSPQPVKRASWPLELTLSPRVRYALPPPTGKPDQDCSLTTYMRLPVSHYSLLALPLGATLTRVAAAGDESSDAVFALTIPRVRLLSLTVQPTVVVAVAPSAQAVRLEAKEASVEGSLVDRLGLNERFEIYGWTEFAWECTSTGLGALVATTDLRVGLDPPPPFSSLPPGLLRRVGNGALNALTGVLQRAFLAALAADYARWSRDAAWRAERAK